MNYKDILRPALAGGVGLNPRLRTYTDPFLGVPENSTPGTQFKEMYDRSQDANRPYASRFLNSFATGVGGDVLDIATDPYTYIGGALIKPIAGAFGRIPFGKTTFGKIATTPITESFVGDIGRMAEGKLPNLGPTEAELIRSGRKSFNQARVERGSPIRGLLADQRGSVDIMPTDMPETAPYNLGAGFGSTVLKAMLESGQGKFMPEQIKSRFGEMSQDEKEMLGWQNWNPDKPMTADELAQKAMQDKMMLSEVVKGQSENIQDKNALAQDMFGRNVDQLTPEELRDFTTEWNIAGTQIESEGRTGTKFQQYQLPGGENYQETLLTLPPSTRASIHARTGELLPYGEAEKRDFKSSHWEEPNVLVHYRTNDRMIGGKPARFLEEVQSDWHQKGRESGYQGGKHIKTADDLQREFPAIVKSFEMHGLSPDMSPDGEQLGFVDSESGDIITADDFKDYGYPEDLAKAADNFELQVNKRNKKAGVPNAPFKKTWHELATKHALAKAAREGKEAVGWTTGEQQAERYDLSKQIDELRWTYDEEGDGVKIHYVRPGESQSSHLGDFGLNRPEIESTIGKEMTKKIRDDVANGRSFGKYSGIDLKVGGEGMKGFYDQILPQFVNKYTKKWGGRVGEAKLPKQIVHTATESYGDEGQKVHTLDITPSMKEAMKIKIRKVIRAKEKND